MPEDIAVAPGTSLRRPTLDHASALFGVVDRERGRLREWLPWVDASATVDDTRAFLTRVIEQEAKRESWTRLVWRDDGPVGVVAFHEFKSANRAGEIGYWLSEVCVGQGIMTAACRVLIREGFGTFGLHRIEIGAATENRRSRAIPQRLGFREEGVRRDAEWLYDHYVDLVVYGLLATDPAAVSLLREPLSR
ncbi:MAG: GNAT family N-acetyltransferase [Proteobacteria bacterium]|nr:GNAT family N-acetyltransferase [Pseudomonadota bacterium]